MTDDPLWQDITEQPDVLRRQVGALEQVAAVAGALRQRGCRQVRFVAHGSSDNAAAYGVHALALLAGTPAQRDSVSLPVYYRAALPLDDTAVVAISRSGRTRDVVGYARAARGAGAATVAITNHSDSPLAEAVEFLIDLRAGPERALAATKTYTASLAALALLAAGLGGQMEAVGLALNRLAASIPAAIDGHRRDVEAVAALLAEHDRVFVTGRGIHYATAREIALKLTETAQLLACALTATDLMDGPIAALERPFPVWVIGGQDSADVAVRQALELAGRAGAPTILSSPPGSCLTADFHLPTPPGTSALLAPMLAVLSGQVLAHATALLRGIEPGRPSALLARAGEAL